MPIHHWNKTGCLKKLPILFLSFKSFVRWFHQLITHMQTLMLHNAIFFKPVCLDFCAKHFYLNLWYPLMSWAKLLLQLLMWYEAIMLINNIWLLQQSLVMMAQSKAIFQNILDSFLFQICFISSALVNDNWKTVVPSQMLSFLLLLMLFVWQRYRKAKSAEHLNDFFLIFIFRSLIRYWSKKAKKKRLKMDHATTPLKDLDITFVLQLWALNLFKFGLDPSVLCIHCLKPTNSRLNCFTSACCWSKEKSQSLC